MNKKKKIDVLKIIQIILGIMMFLVVLLGLYLGYSCGDTDECGGGWAIIFFVIPAFIGLTFVFAIITGIRGIRNIIRKSNNK